MKEKSKRKIFLSSEKPISRKLSENYSNELIKEVKESLENYKKGKYVKGNVNDVMKAIRNYENKTDRN